MHSLDKEEACTGIRLLFNSVISSRLLYDVERPTHDKYFAAHPSTEPADAYGRNHLLRLLCQSALLAIRNAQRSLPN